MAVLAILFVSGVHQAWIPPVVLSSQIPGHMYFASRTLEGPVQKYLGDDPQQTRSFLLGSIGPDVLWIASLASSPALRASLEKQFQIRLPDEWARISLPLPDIHWQQSVETTLNLLASARTPKEEAYALGWVTHFIADARMHPIINRRAGAPKDVLDLKDISLREHERLEATESRHIYSRYVAAMRLKYFDDDDPLETPTDLVIRAMNLSFPGHAALHPSNLPAVKSVILSSEHLTLSSSHWYWYQATHDRRHVERVKALLQRFRPEKAKMARYLSDLPSKEEYEAKLRTSEFLAEWEAAKDLVLADTEELLRQCVLYLWLHKQATTQPEIGDEVLRRIEGRLRLLSPGGDIR